MCRREFDARFEVFAGGSGESYDSVECARRAASSAGAPEVFPPALLPTIELLPLARSTAAAPPATLLLASRRRLAAALAVPFLASPAAVAAGLSLVAVGTATSLALWSPSLGENGKPVVTASAAAPTPPSLAGASPALSSEPGDAGDGMQPAESGAPSADQGASDGEVPISFAAVGRARASSGRRRLRSRQRGTDTRSAELGSSFAYNTASGDERAASAGGAASPTGTGLRGRAWTLLGRSRRHLLGRRRLRALRLRPCPARRRQPLRARHPLRRPPTTRPLVDRLMRHPRLRLHRPRLLRHPRLHFGRHRRPRLLHPRLRLLQLRLLRLRARRSKNYSTASSAATTVPLPERFAR